MKSTARFLLGGVLGMVVGYLLAQRSGKRPAASVVKESASYVTRTVDLSSEAVSVPAVAVSEAEVGSGEGLVSESPEGLVSESPEGETSLAECQQVETVPASDVPEVIVTPEILEEPLPGSGWEPAASLAVTEEVIEEVLPVVPDLSTAAEGALPEEAPPAEEQVDEEVHAAETALIEDLKARIEATRRRIREELEHPFVTVVTEPSAKPEGEPDQAAEQPERELPEASVTAPLEAEAEAQAGTAAQAEDFTVETAAVSREEVGVDYESVRQRIEQVRSRLKAKAFDAMMSGEAALLGRDTGRPAKAKRSGVPVVDAEIDETIETTLREEEV